MKTLILLCITCFVFQVLKNLQNYLLEEEIKMIKADAECKCIYVLCNC